MNYPPLERQVGLLMRSVERAKAEAPQPTGAIKYTKGKGEASERGIIAYLRKVGGARPATEIGAAVGLTTSGADDRCRAMSRRKDAPLVIDRSYCPLRYRLAERLQNAGAQPTARGE
jgi:hypothetical protein